MDEEFIKLDNEIKGLEIDCEDFEKEKKELLKKLENEEILFNWDLNQLGSEEFNIIARLQEKDQEIVDSQQFKFRNFILQLLIAYNYFIKKEKTISEKIIKHCEQILNELKQNNCEEPLFVVVYNVLLNIVLGCETYMMLQLDMISEAKENQKKLVSLTDLTAQQKAALLGIKAAVLMENGNDKFEAALELASQARDLDPSIAEWHFIFGVLLARSWHMKNIMKEPKKVEIAAVEEAVRLSNNIRYKLHLAQIYREEAFRLFSTYRYDVRNNLERDLQTQTLNKKSSEIYRELLNTYNDNARLLAHCAFGITKLPRTLRDVQLAVESVEKAYKLSPNHRMINHYVGIIYERFANKSEEAVQFYSAAVDLGEYGAAMDLIRLKFTQNPNEYNPVQDLENAAEKFIEKDRRYQSLSQIASYYFFHKDNIPESWKYLEEIATNDPNHARIRKHKSITLRMNDSCDLCEVILDNIKEKIDEKKYDTENDKETLMNIRSALQNLCPDSPEFQYERLKSKILKKSRDLHKRSNDNIYKWLKTTDYRVNRDETRRNQSNYTRKTPLSFVDFKQTSQLTSDKQYSNKFRNHSFDQWNRRPQGNYSRINSFNVNSDPINNPNPGQSSRSQPEIVADDSRIEHQCSMFYPKFK